MEFSGSFEPYPKYRKGKKDKYNEKLKWRNKKGLLIYPNSKEFKNMVEQNANKKISKFVNQHTGEIEGAYEVLGNKKAENEIEKIADKLLVKVYQDIDNMELDDILKASEMALTVSHKLIIDNYRDMLERAKNQARVDPKLIIDIIDKIQKATSNYHAELRKHRKESVEIVRGRLKVNLNVDKPKEKLKTEERVIEVEHEDTSDS